MGVKIRLKLTLSKTKAQIEALAPPEEGRLYFASDSPTIYLGSGGVAIPYGTGDVAVAIHAATNKVTPVDADEFGIWDSVSMLLRKVTWANIKTTLKTYFDSWYVLKNTAITGATKTKITYDSKGLVTSGTDATTADIAASTDKNYVTDSEAVVIGNTSGSNSGDQDLSGLQGKALTTGKMWQGVAGVAAEVDPPSGYSEAVVQVKTASFTAVAGIPYRITGSTAITVTVPSGSGDRIAIVNASTAITTVGALGDLAAGDSCVLYYDSTWKEYTNRLT